MAIAGKQVEGVMKKSIRRNYIYNLSYQILLIIVPLITTPYVSRVLGAEGVGTYSFAMSISSYFVLFATLGTTTYGQREISYHQAESYGRSVVFYDIVAIRFVTTTIASIAYLGFLALSGMLTPVSVVLIMNVFAVGADVTWFFQGLEEFGKVIGRNLLIRLAIIAFIFLFVKNREDLITYAFGISMLPFLGNLSLIPFLRKYLTKIKLSDFSPLSRIKTMISLFIPTIAIQVYTVLDKTMIGLITMDARQNGYYEQSQKIVTIALAVVTSLGTVMVPRIGSLFSSGRIDDLRRYMERSYRFVWFLGLPLAFGIASSAASFVPWFFGEGYEGVVRLLWVFSIQLIAIGISNVTGIQYLVPTGRQNLLTRSVVIGAAVNLIMNLLLIPMYGAFGAAIASVIAEIVIATTQLIMVRDELNVTAVLLSATPYCISSIIMFVFLNIVSRYFSPAMISTITMILLGVAIYGSLLFAMKDEMLAEVINSAKRVLSHDGS